jgi:methanogenic corrinoid protein MtbC1
MKIKAEGLDKKIKVIVGSAPATQAWADRIGADGYRDDAIGVVNVVRRLLEK